MINRCKEDCQPYLDDGHDEEKEPKERIALYKEYVACVKGVKDEAEPAEKPEEDKEADE